MIDTWYFNLDPYLVSGKTDTSSAKSETFSQDFHTLCLDSLTLTQVCHPRLRNWTNCSLRESIKNGLIGHVGKASERHVLWYLFRPHRVLNLCTCVQATPCIVAYGQ